MGEEELDIRGGFANPERASEILQQIQLLTYLAQARLTDEVSFQQ